jgi:hypothetical protein
VRRHTSQSPPCYFGPYRKAIDKGEGIEAGKKEVVAQLAERARPGILLATTSS